MSKMPNKKIAITGTIGSGKSTATKYIAKQLPTISSDEIVDQLYCDKNFIKQVNKLIYNSNSDRLDKRHLAETIFHDKRAKEKLEALIHPLVKIEIETFMNKQEGIVFAEVPLLYEANFVSMFDEVILVVADEDIIIERLIKNRGYTKEEAIARINNQFSVAYKIKHADIVLYNNGSQEELEMKIEKVLEKLKKGD